MFSSLRRIRTRFSSRSSKQIQKKRNPRRLKLESLETRCVLATLGTLTPSITGTVFLDGDGSGSPSVGEGIADVVLELYEDDGNGVLDGSDSLVGNTTTDSEGIYCFENLEPDSGYFVFKPAQLVNGTSIEEQQSGELRPGLPALLIDGFETAQSATASPPAPSAGDSIELFADETEVIGLERDILANLDSGTGVVDVSINPFGTRPTLQYNSQVAVTGSGTIVWDGVDNDATTISLGLTGRDLTQQNSLNGIVLWIGASVAGAQARLRLYEGGIGNFSEATLNIPVSSGGAADSYEFIPFSAFSGPVTVTDVDAITLTLDSNTSQANNIELASIGANGPRVVDFLNMPETDLEITKTNLVPVLVPGQAVRYTLQVNNSGPSDAFGATIIDNLPNELNSVTYTSQVTGNATGNTPSGTGNINDTVFMESGSSIIYTVDGVVNPDVIGSLSNTATVSVPNGMIDTDPSNNSATDSDPLQPEADLTITKDNGRTSVVPGQQVTYTVLVTNAGPSQVDGATVVDNLPAELTNATYQSVAVGNVVGNTDGSGSVSDVVDMPPGSSITYTIQGTIAAGATGVLTNTATVNAPVGTTDLNQANNTATDSDNIVPEVDLSITKSDGLGTVVPNDVVTYVIEVRNEGPSNASNATVTDVFPTSLTNISYTSTGSAGVTGNTTSGLGNISDQVTLPSGSLLTYTATATVSAGAIGTVTNTATIEPPPGAIDVSTGNDSATDIDTITPTYDLSVSKTDGRSTVVAGEDTTYTIEVNNSGPSGLTGAAVNDTFPSELTSVSYTSVADGGATGNTPSGSGNINDLLSLPAGSTVTYLASGRVPSNASGTISNTASIESGPNDANPENDSATDVSSVVLEADLSIMKTDSREEAVPGDILNYALLVRNQGPSDVVGATVVDNLPNELNNVSYTSLANGGATGNTNGSGNINDVVNLPAGSSVNYSIQSTVNENAVGVISNTASISAPDGVTETNAGNNSDTDTTVIDVVLRSISGFVYVDRNNDGQLEQGEQPIEGVGILLNGEDNLENAIDRATRTAVDGQYRFDELPPGSYTIRQNQPDVFPDGQETVGTGATVPPTVADNVFEDLGLGREQDAEGFNFAELRPTRSKRDYLASSFDGL